MAQQKISAIFLYSYLLPQTGFMAIFFCHRQMFYKMTTLFLSLTAFAAVCSAQNPATQTNPENTDTVTGGIKPKFGSSTFYVAYFGLAYTRVHRDGRKKPFASSHTIGLNYSVVLHSLHPYYEGLFPQAIGKWSLSVKGGYDGLRRMNYYGLGNESKRSTSDNRFNWMRTHHQYAAIGISRWLGSHHELSGGVLYDGTQVLNDENRFVSKTLGTIDPETYNWQYFLSGRLSHTYQRLNHPQFPTRGVEWTTAVSHTENLRRSSRSFTRYATDLDAYLPLSATFSLAVRTGLCTLTGEPDFYQYNTVGGGRTLRGYRRWRFYGKTAFYNQNELRWLTGVDDGSAQGHFGFLVLYDQARVWLPGETSGKMHFGYGAGVIMAPYDKIWITSVFAISNEERRFHFTVGRDF